MLNKLLTLFGFYQRSINETQPTENETQIDNESPLKSQIIINLPALVTAIRYYGDPKIQYDANKIKEGELDSILKILYIEKPAFFNTRIFISNLSTSAQINARNFLYYAGSKPQTTFIVDMKTDIDETYILIKEGRFSQGIIDIKDYQDIREHPKPRVFGR